MARDKSGRFKKGASGNPRGRPGRDRERKYMEIAKSTVTYKQWAEIVKSAASDALDGDAQARRFLADYLLGPPGKLRERPDASKTQAPTVESTGDIVALLARELADVGRFENHPQRAALVARLADGVLKAIELDTLAGRVEAIEHMLKERGK